MCFADETPGIEPPGVALSATRVRVHGRAPPERSEPVVEEMPGESGTDADARAQPGRIRQVVEPVA